MGYQESRSFFEYQDGNTGYWSSIGSYAFEFLPLAFPENKASYKHLLSLGCGYMGDLIGTRIFFGDEIEITGVDNHPNLLTSGFAQEELGLNLYLARANFLYADMNDVAGITQALPDIDVIAIRHPGVVKKSERFADLEAGIVSWMNLAHEKEIPLVLSFFKAEKERRDHLAEVAAEIVGNDAVRLIDKQVSDKDFYRVVLAKPIYPDFYGFVMSGK